MATTTAADWRKALAGIADEIEASLVGKLELRLAFFEWNEGTEGPSEDELYSIPVLTNCRWHRGFSRRDISGRLRKSRNWIHVPGFDWQFAICIPDAQWEGSQSLTDSFSDLLFKANCLLEKIEIASPRIQSAPRDLKLVACFLDTLLPRYYGFCGTNDGKFVWCHLELEDRPPSQIARAWVSDDFARHAVASLRRAIEDIMPSINPHPGLNDSEISICEAIDQLWEGGLEWPDIDDISKQAGMVHKTAKDYITPMARHGILEKGPSGRGFKVRT
jgi:hypothetical protein